MPVIRRESVPNTPLFSFRDVEREAEQIRAAARAEAERLIAEGRRRAAALEQEVHQQAERQRRDAYQQALAAGREDGRRQAHAEARQAAAAAAQEEIKRLTAALQAALAEFDRQKRTLLAAAESGLIELSLAIARRVCKCLGASSVEPARANAQALLELVKHQADVVVHFHPQDHALIQATAADFIREVSALRHVTLCADPTVPRGGCVLHSRDGRIDATLETQLDRIAAAICPAPISTEPPA